MLSPARFGSRSHSSSVMNGMIGCSSLRLVSRTSRSTERATARASGSDSL